MQDLINTVTFDGTNGSAWPTGSTTWTNTNRGGAGTYDIQSNRGRLRTAATGGYADSAMVRSNRYLNGPVEITWTWILENPTVSEYFPTMGVGDGNWTGENQTNGIGIDYDWGGGYTPFTMNGGSQVTGTTAGIGHTAGLDVKCRMIIKAGLFKFKTWETTDEPAAWTCEWAPAFQWEGGYLMTRITAGAAATAKECSIENLRVRSLLPAPTAAITYRRR